MLIQIASYTITLLIGLVIGGWWRKQSRFDRARSRWLIELRNLVVATAGMEADYNGPMLMKREAWSEGFAQLRKRLGGCAPDLHGFPDWLVEELTNNVIGVVDSLTRLFSRRADALTTKPLNDAGLVATVQALRTRCTAYALFLTHAPRWLR